MPSVAAVSLGGAVLFAAASSTKSPTSASSSVSLAGNSLLCPNAHVLRGLSLRRARRRGGRRIETVRAGKDDEANKNQGEKGPVDWDKAWSSYKKPQKKRSFLKIDMEQYVTRRPTHSDYPLSEEVDPLRKSERSALGAWTSLNFTFSMVFVIIGLAVYMVIIVGPPPLHH